MEDTKSLLMMVLQKVFQDRPKIVEETFQLIFNYNNGKREKREYEKILKTICDLMNDELPSQILVYLLTMVDMPKEGGRQLPIMEKMQKTHNCLAESVRPHLLDFLKNKKPNLASPGGEQAPKSEAPVEEKYDNKAEPQKSPQSDEDCFVKPAKRAKRTVNKKIQASKTGNGGSKMQSLLDICAGHVVKNEFRLKQRFKKRLERAWQLINKNALSGESLMICYEVVRDLNRKLKLLRMIEDDNITTEVLMEEYKDVDIFLKEQHMYHIVNNDPFNIS